MMPGQFVSPGRYKVETGPLGENALSAALPRPLVAPASVTLALSTPSWLRPGTPAAMRKNNGAVSNLASEIPSSSD